MRVGTQARLALVVKRAARQACYPVSLAAALPRQANQKGRGWASSMAIRGAVHPTPELLDRIAFVSFVEVLAGVVPGLRNVGT
ncbi:hypothetical protein LBW56_23435, partial [Ralstonia solanacearum]|uniref:hypothetical protein n=1 Tax=Ralstonia solanacearum TaxID=305 RepID=UPI002306975A